MCHCFEYNRFDRNRFAQTVFDFEAGRQQHQIELNTRQERKPGGIM